MPRVICDNERCLACKACEIACAVQHSAAKSLAGVFEEPPRVRVSRLPEARGLPLRCMQCEEAPCVMACMSGALQRDAETGLVKHDADKCVGCWMCVMVCPFGGVRPLRSRGVVTKCDLCEGEETPACVAACPTHALSVDETTAEEV